MMVVVFDTETSDLVFNRTLPVHKQPELVEFYACVADLENGDVHKEFESFFKPGRLLSEENIKVHKITNEMLASAPYFEQHAAEVRAILQAAPVIIAHNLKFDQEVMEISFGRIGQPPPEWPESICTVEQTMHLTGTRLSLSALHEHLFGTKHTENKHRAKGDVLALLKCAVELHRRDII